MPGGATISVEGIGNEVRGCGDYDGDGANDLLFWNVFVSGDPARPIPARDEVRLIRGGAQRWSGRFDVVLQQANPESNEGNIQVAAYPAGDFDGDGRADLLMGGTRSGIHLKFGGPLPQRSLH